ncbi:unnamed protein product [Adineta steineri]|uniref:Uncharacterized protein n=1 Tax=Adineta steineri TaxID=433720 RepID=A0A819YPM9_9BILA|nr:unnamed protein product [Adineta steineri]
MGTSSILLNEVSAWLTHFNQHVKQVEDVTISAGAISPDQIKAAQLHEGNQDNKSIIIDAKNHVARIPSGQWKKLKRDMKEADYGVLVLNETGYFGKKS